MDGSFDLSRFVGSFATSATVAMVVYLFVLAYPLYRVGRRSSEDHA